MVRLGEKKLKKIICILFSFTVLIASLFADKSRFYENGKVIDTVYVDSEDGLKVRDYPSLKSNRICGLSHKMRLQVVAVGKEETIDNITDPWVEILIPNIYWKNRNVPEYGWVFGGYLSKNWPGKGLALHTLNEKKEYLTQFNYYWAHYPYFVKFYKNGSCDWFVESSPKYGKGTWTLDENDNLVLSRDDSSWTEKYHIKKYDYGFFETDTPLDLSDRNVTFGLRIDWDVHLNPELIYTKEIYYLYDREMLFCADESYFKDNYEKLTKSGIAPLENSDNPYFQKRYDSYKRYWEPIKTEHQKKADEMK